MRLSIRFHIYAQRSETGALIDCTEAAVIAPSLDEAEKKVKQIMGERLGERHIRVASFMELEEKA